MRTLSILLFVILITTLLRTECYSSNYNLNYGVESLQRSIDSLSRVDSPSNFRFYKLILPSSPIVIGSLTLYVSQADELDMTLSDMISSGHGKLHFDDYLQYSPVAIMWGLNLVGGKGLQPYHKFKQQTTILLMASLTSLAAVQCTKEFVDRRRPDTGVSNSFPSGHTTTAFMCAEMLHQEYGHHSGWISAVGYSLATVTAYMRVYNERHYIGDIVAGAGIGILSTRIAYWAAPRLNNWLWGDVTGYNRIRSRDRYRASLSPCATSESYGLNLSVTF